MNATSTIRPAVHRCMTLAARSAVAGDHTRARSFFILALDLATPAESATVLRAANQLLGGLAPEPVAAATEAPADPPAEAADEPTAEAEAPPSERAASAAPPAAEPAAEPAVEKPVAPPAAPPRPRPARPERPAPRPRRRSVSAGGFAGPLFGALVVGALIWGGITVLAPDPVDVRKVEAALASGRASEALEQLEGVDGADPRVSLLRGRALLASGDTAAARRSLTTAAASPAAEGELGVAASRAQRILDRLDDRGR